MEAHHQSLQPPPSNIMLTPPLWPHTIMPPESRLLDNILLFGIHLYYNHGGVNTCIQVLLCKFVCVLKIGSRHDANFGVTGHGGTTEEGNCSYLLPRAAAAGSKRHKYGPNTGKVPLYEITWFLVYRIGETRSQLGANNGNLVCLVREIWQIKLFAGKEVTAVPTTRREGGYWRRGRRLLGWCWNWTALSFLNFGNKMIAYS